VRTNPRRSKPGLGAADVKKNQKAVKETSMEVPSPEQGSALLTATKEERKKTKKAKRQACPYLEIEAECVSVSPLVFAPPSCHGPAMRGRHEICVLLCYRRTLSAVMKLKTTARVRGTSVGARRRPARRRRRPRNLMRSLSQALPYRLFDWM
jgi:hypothetical protein